MHYRKVYARLNGNPEDKPKIMSINDLVTQLAAMPDTIKAPKKT